jgi:hypothetical protein
MKQDLFSSKNTPYLTAGICIVLGIIIVSYGYLSATPATRDPNIGEGLILLFGYFLVAVGVASGFIILLVHKFKNLKKR